MKNKFKITLPLLLILCIASLLLLAGCGGKEITDAYITNSNLPRTTYVEGQELDLSKGYLTVIRGGEEANIPFTAEGVTVTGYDKSTVGEQTVTVSYDAVSTTFTVKVIPRVVAENYETKYFVGDSFNKTLGRLRIADDNAKITNVNFNDSKISLVSFDSETPGKKTITIKYTSGSTVYECQFDVTVYEAANVEFTPPKNTSFSSHKEKLEDKDVRDGFFTVTSADGKLTKVVPLIADLVKGFDPSAATMENRDEPVEQTLTIDYLGHTFDYKINIFFSDVSVVNYYASGVLNGLDLSGNLTDDQCRAALQAVLALIDLSPSDKSLISKSHVQNIVGAAAVGVTQLFVGELESCKNAFSMNSSGEVGLIGANYADTAKALEKLNDPDSDLNVYVGVLRTLLADYSATKVTSAETVSDVVIVYSVDMENLLIPVLDHLVTVHELLDDIPREWKNETLEIYGTDILDALIEIKRSEFYQKGFGAFYTDVLSKWRAENDLLEIIYSYFLYVYDGADDFMQTNVFGYFPMPGMLEDLYEQLMNTYSMQVTLYQNQQGNMWLTDLSRYATSYFLTLDFATAVKSSENTLWLDIYNEYSMDYVIASYTSAQNFGFAYHAGAMLDSDNFKLIWQQYYGILQLYLTGKLNATQHEALVYGLFDTLSEMNPTEVFGFLSSLNLNYGNARGASPVLYLDFEENIEANIFASVMREYYCKYLTENNVTLFSDLLLAMESAALFGENDEALANFVGIMGSVVDGRSKLTSQTDIENFDKYLGKSYKKYLDIYKRIIGEYNEKPTDDELAKIAELRRDMELYEDIYQHIISLPQSGITNAHYVLLYSAYAKASVTYKSIVSTGSDAALTVLFTEGFTFLERSGTVGKSYYQIDKETTLMMQSATALPIDDKIVLVSYWDTLFNYGLVDIYAQMRDLLFFVLVDETATPNEQILGELATKFASLDDTAEMLLATFGGDSVYYSAKCSYLAKVFKDNATVLGVANALCEASVLFENYCMYPNNTSFKTDFLAKMNEIEASYSALTEEQKNALGEVYDFYREMALEISAEA